MSIRSHLDPCFFIVFMHIGGPNLTPNLAKVVQSLQLKQQASIDPVLQELTFRSHQTLFHEEYHFWQGLRLPFLFRYAFLAFFNVIRSFRWLADTTTDFKTWDCVIPDFERLSLAAYVGSEAPGKLYWTEDAGKVPSGTTATMISPLDLLECAASMAEFQVTAVGAKTDPATLRRWLKRNPAYLEPYNFVSRFLGDETLALRLILPLLNACFHTTDPSRTFILLLARVWGRLLKPNASMKVFLDQKEPCRWPALFQSWLDEIEFEAAPDSDTKILGGSYHRLTLDHWIFADYSGPHGNMGHPLLSPFARRWRKLEESELELSWLIDQPAWVSEDRFWETRRMFQPPISFARFHTAGGNDRSFWWGSLDLDGFTSLAGMNKEQYRGILADTLTMYSAVRRASGAHFDGSQRTCHHSKCPHYESNYCNSYPIVPQDYLSCGFPARMERLVVEWGTDNGNS